MDTETTIPLAVTRFPIPLIRVRFPVGAPRVGQKAEGGGRRAGHGTGIRCQGQLPAVRILNEPADPSASCPAGRVPLFRLRCADGLRVRFAAPAQARVPKVTLRLQAQSSAFRSLGVGIEAQAGVQ